MDDLYKDARIIDNVFRQHGIRARVNTHAVAQSSASNVMLLDTAPNVRVTHVTRLADNIDQSLTLARGAETHCRFEATPLRISTPRKHPQVADVLDVLPQVRNAVGDGLSVLVGECVRFVNGALRVRPYIADMTNSTTPHVLVAGTTGSGKTTALIDLVVSLATLNDTGKLSMRVLDPKNELHILNGLPGMEYAAVNDAADCVDALRQVVAEMDARRKRGDIDPERRIVVVIDEMADLVSVAGDDVLTALERILQAGRGLGIHCIGATQKPLSSVLGSLAKANFPLRLVGRVMSRTDANVAAGISDTGAERLPGNGAFVKVSNSVESVQAYRVDKRRVAALASGIVRRYSRQSDALRSDDAIPAVNTGINTGRRLEFDVNRQPTRDEARVIRAMLKTYSKNAVIREFFPTASKDKCLRFINAASTRQEVSA